MRRKEIKTNFKNLNKVGFILSNREKRQLPLNSSGYLTRPYTPDLICFNINHHHLVLNLSIDGVMDVLKSFDSKIEDSEFINTQFCPLEYEDIEIDRADFVSALSKLCLLNSYNTEKYPASIEHIIHLFGLKLKDEQNLLFDYFLQEERTTRRLKEIKLQEYVNFIRDERNKLYPNSYKVKIARKFMSSSGRFKRGSTLQEYLDGYLNNENPYGYTVIQGS